VERRPGARRAVGSAVTRRVVRRNKKSRSSDVESAAPGPRLRSRSTSPQVRETSDPILRTAGPPAHTHVPGDLGVSHGSRMVSDGSPSVNLGHQIATLVTNLHIPGALAALGSIGATQIVRSPGTSRAPLADVAWSAAPAEHGSIPCPASSDGRRQWSEAAEIAHSDLGVVPGSTGPNERTVFTSFDPLASSLSRRAAPGIPRRQRPISRRWAPQGAMGSQQARRRQDLASVSHQAARAGHGHDNRLAFRGSPWVPPGSPMG
jgi:hypothetical protein